MPLHDVLRQRMQPLTAAVTSNRIFLYSVFSTFAVAATIANACRAQSNFYSVSIYLSKSSRSVLVLANFAFLCAILCGKIFQRLFFGTLQPREVERLYDQTWMFVTESLLAFTIFRDEFDVPFLLMFGFLLFVKCFHWLMADRVESMDQFPYPGPPTLFHVRINALFVVLWAIDTTMFVFAVESTLNNGVGGMVLFASEYAILLASALDAMLRYALSILDLRRARTRGGENAPPWENKSMYIFYIELLTDFLKLTTYMTFFMIILTFYGLPLNIIRDVFVTARSFITRLRALIRYHNATRDMDRRYPDATEAELAEMSDRTCIICREEMQSRNATAQPERATNGDPQQQPLPLADGPNMTPKKLPCGHIFHFQCLRSWLERQQSCPTCRRTVLDNNAPQNPRQAPEQGQPGAAPPRQGAARVPRARIPPAQPGAAVAGNGPLGWVGRLFGVPQPPAVDGQFPGAQARFPQGAPPQPAFQQHVVPNPDGAFPPHPPMVYYDPATGDWHPVPRPPMQQQPPMFRGFYGPGQVWQPWGDADAFRRQAPQPDAPAGVEQPRTTPPQAHAQQGPSAPSVPSATTHEQRRQPAGESQALSPTPTTASSSTPGSPSMEPPTTSEPSVDPRRAAAQAALRRLNPSASASTSPSAVSPNSLPMPAAPPANAAPTPSSSSSSMDANSSAAPVSVNPASRSQHTVSGPSTSDLGSTEQPSTSAEPAGQPALPRLIPLYDPSLLQSISDEDTVPPYAPFPFLYRAPNVHASTQRPVGSRRPAHHQAPHSARAGQGTTRTPLMQLPPSLTDEQLARLDRLTREAIDERLRVLEGVSGAIYRCMEELTRVRSVLPSTSARLAQAREPSSSAPTSGSADPVAMCPAASSSGFTVDTSSATPSEDDWVSPDAAEPARSRGADGVTSQ